MNNNKGVFMKIVLASKQFIPTTKTATVIGDSLGHDLFLNKGQYHHLNTRTQVKGLGPCIKLTAWAEKNKFEAHSAPELEPIEAVGARISEMVEGLRARLRNSFNDVHAFITGGIERNPNNPVSEQSMDLLEEMYEALMKEGVPTSVIAAQRGNSINSRIDTLTFKDNMFMYGKPIDDVLNSNASLKDALEERFAFVELSDKIPVSIMK